MKRKFEDIMRVGVSPTTYSSVQNPPDAEHGRLALKHRGDWGHFGWRQDDLFMAHLGLADETWRGLVQRATPSKNGQRFPIFWGRNYDWTPDQTHGGVLVGMAQAPCYANRG